MTTENKAAAALAGRIISGAVANAGPIDEVRDFLEHQVRNSIRVDDDGNLNVIDANGVPRVSMRPGCPPMTLEELLDEIKISKPILFRPPGNSAASNSSGGPQTDPANPFSRAGWNITSQMTLMKSDPARAAQLQVDAAR